MIPGERIIPQSEVIRAIVLEDSPWCAAACRRTATTTAPGTERHGQHGGGKAVELDGGCALSHRGTAVTPESRPPPRRPSAAARRADKSRFEDKSRAPPPKSDHLNQLAHLGEPVAHSGMGRDVWKRLVGNINRSTERGKTVPVGSGAVVGSRGSSRLAGSHRGGSMRRGDVTG